MLLKLLIFKFLLLKLILLLLLIIVVIEILLNSVLFCDKSLKVVCLCLVGKVLSIELCEVSFFLLLVFSEW